MANRVTSISGASTDNEYPTAKLLYDQLAGKAAALGADDNYVTDAEKIVIGNTSGTNTGDQTATTVANTPAGNIAAVTVQAAINELDTEKAALSGATFTGAISATNLSGTNTGNQTITNSSDATSHTVTLSASGGSVQLVEGANITLTTTGTGSAGVVTIAATAGGTGDVV